MAQTTLPNLLSKDKPLLVNKGSKYLSLLQLLLILFLILSTAPPLAPIVPPRLQNFVTISRNPPFNSMSEKSSTSSFVNFHMSGIETCYFLQFSSDTTTSIVHPTLTKLREDGITVYTFLQTAPGNMPSIVTFPAFSLLTFFAFLAITLNLFYF